MRFLFAFLCLPLFAFAADDVPPNATILTLQERAELRVDHDRLKAVLRIEHEAKSPELVQNEINQQMARAVRLAERQQAIKATTRGYHVNKRVRWLPKDRNDEQRQEDYWHGAQVLELDTENGAVLLKLVGEIQALGFNMDNLSYYLSREAAASYRDQLIKDALAKLQARAKMIGEQLGQPNVTFKTISFDGTRPEPRPVKMMARMETMALSATADMAAPVAVAGDTLVDVTVHTEVLLAP